VALSYLPKDISHEIDGKIAFTVLGSGRLPLAKEICNHEEIIILSPWIFSFIPPTPVKLIKNGDISFFCVLHEVAHAVRKHLPPNELSTREAQDQS